MKTVYPYKLGPTWVFDHSGLGLKEEAFVLGASEAIDRLVKELKLKQPEKGFSLSFTDDENEAEDPFIHLHWLSHGQEPVGRSPAGDPVLMGGDWYRGNLFGRWMTLWLCPALLLFFEKAPESIFVTAGNLPYGIDPIWKRGQDRGGKRFVGKP